MNANKICFLSCVNNEELYQQCLLAIHSLEVPVGYEIETLAIRAAGSMTAGYNEAMNRTDAKYKVYLHQDVLIINKHLLQDVLNLFSESQIGMIGVAGSRKIPTSGVWWEAGRLYGKVYDSHSGVMSLLAFQEVEENYQEVQGIDGLIMITQVDLPWRQDIFTGWHFYDLSQCREFNHAGYKVIIPRQQQPWCIHDCGVVSVRDYHYYRQAFLNEYGPELFS
jgi:hypothetical protein